MTFPSAMLSVQNSVTWLILLLVLAAGCSRSPSEVGPETAVDAREASFRGVPPQQYLSAVFSRYRSAACYHDRGRVQLTYRVNGGSQTTTAPLQVWLDHGRLYVEAYDVRIWSDSRQLNAWVDDPGSANFDSQVLQSAPMTGRPNLPSLRQ